MTKKTNEIRCNTPGTLSVLKSKYGNPLRKRPIRKRIKDLFRSRNQSFDDLFSTDLYFFNERLTETPIMNKNNGKIKSVGVIPCHEACSNGE